MNAETLWKTIKTLIDEQNTYQDWVAEHSNISPRTFQNWIYRKRWPNGYELYRIAKTLKTTVEYLITNHNEAGLTPEQCILLEKYNQLDKPCQRIVFDLINSLIKEFLNMPEKEESLLKTEIYPVIASEVMEPEPEYTLNFPEIMLPVRENTIGNVVFLDWDVVDIPYLGQTAAGMPIEIIIDPDTPTEKFPRPTIRGRIEDHFCVKIRGTSMVEADIRDGDLALIKTAEEPEDNTIMLVRYGNESTLKRIRKKRNAVFLCWEDGSDKIIEAKSDEYEIQGKLVMIQRKPR
jgi:SOS-response transcriptional repressor LexA